MKFEKYHGAGNDFVVVDSRVGERNWASLASEMCERHFGVGSDGLIVVGQTVDHMPTMRMFNPDGSESEACGNGLRCFVKYVVDHSIVSGDEFDVDTLGGRRSVTALRTDGGSVDAAEVSMGVPIFVPADVPVQVPEREGPVLGLLLTVRDVPVTVNVVSIGNPHAVTFVTDDVSTYPLCQRGPAVEKHAVFPSRVNFEVARVLGREDIEARVWERGAGETLACGSGACAIAVTSRLLGYCDDVVRIHLPGGVLTVTWSGGTSEVLLRGPVKQVFVGDWPD
ncbi:MAG: diaminopimelate epimerase [Dehalococcoidia bacterium]|nr:diaminopimelate epimerase [Dehalococcoidia bacterium]